ncbi:uncharacterized protein LOC143453249 [Clavelina lepadiformis]|uniref:uncharacterized protein LOC143453249 n=1 Tax=Clavelina lepadiformis TaxID=159417 RepID=UPI004043259B
MNDFNKTMKQEFENATSSLEVVRNKSSINYVRQVEPEWIIIQTSNIVLILATLWILISLIHYGKKAGKWKKVLTKNVDKLSGGDVYTSTVACAAMSLLRHLTTLVSLQVGFAFDQDWDCERVFYTNNMMRTGYSKVLRMLSAGSIIIITVAGFGVIFVNTLPFSYRSSPYGCVYVLSNGPLETTSWAVCAAVLVSGQVMLISLFAYPLHQNFDCSNLVDIFKCSCFNVGEESVTVRQGKYRLRVLSNDQSSNVGDDCLKTSEIAGVNAQEQKGGLQDISSRSRNEYTSSVSVVSKSLLNINSNNDKLGKTPIRRSKKTSKRCYVVVKKILQRTILFGLLSILTDITLIIISTYSLHGSAVQRRISVILFDVNVFFNLIFVICSFLSYKPMLTSPFQGNPEDVTKQHSSTSNA